MKQYLEVLNKLVYKAEEGEFKSDRTGTGTASYFGTQLRFDLSDGKLPLLTTKKLHLKSIVHELVWFLKGSGNIAYLKEHGVSIWNEWADKDGNLGPVYPVMWRQWPDFKRNLSVETEYEVGHNIFTESSIDQIKNVIDGIKMNPTSRRHIVTGWNPALLSQQALPPCHTLFQFNCEKILTLDRWAWLDSINQAKGALFRAVMEKPDSKDSAEFLTKMGVPEYYLDCQLYQRSADWFLGVPFNIASYSILTHMIGKLTNTLPREFIHTFGDYHLYSNHISQAKEQLSRTPKENTATILLNIDTKTSIDDIKYEDITIIGYDPLPAIKAPVAV